MSDVEQYIARRRDVIEQLRDLLIEQLHLPFAPDQIDPDAAFFGSGLGLDSVDAMEILVLVEGHFGIAMGEPDAQEAAPQAPAMLQQSLRTLNTLVDAILWLQDHPTAQVTSQEVSP